MQAGQVMGSRNEEALVPSAGCKSGCAVDGEKVETSRVPPQLEDYATTAESQQGCIPDTLRPVATRPTTVDT
jgi:hypothetical protein